MKRTMELVDLLYWTPAPSKLTEQVVAASFANRQAATVSHKKNTMESTYHRIGPPQKYGTARVGSLKFMRSTKDRYDSELPIDKTNLYSSTTAGADPNTQG